MYLQITRCEITQSSCKRGTKSKSHVGMKLAPVRVFSCKHPPRLTHFLTLLRTTYHAVISWSFVILSYENLFLFLLSHRAKGDKRLVGAQPRSKGSLYPSLRSRRENLGTRFVGAMVIRWLPTIDIPVVAVWRMFLT